MNIFIKAILVFLTGFSALVYGSDDEEFRSEFVQEGTFYSFRGSFVVEAEYECLLDVIYRFEHISRYAAGAHSVELGCEGENWYEVTYTYQRFRIFENQSTWRRTLKRDERTVVFEMITNRTNLGIMPEMLSSQGYYHIEHENGGYRVEYFQECTLSKSLLNGVYIKTARNEAIEFLHDFKKYIENICK